MNKLKKISLGLGALIIVGAFILIVGGWLITSYNSFITQNEDVNTQWAQVETQYQRRFDLIPNLVEAAKGIFEQEKDVFGALAEARSRYAGASTPSQKAEAATQVEGALSRLLVIVENYPELRSSESVQTLMAQLEGTENRVSVERSRYNGVARDYNLAIQKVPSRYAASLFGFEQRPYFEAAEGAQLAPQVQF